MLLAIDPGADQGWAYFVSRRLCACGLGSVPALDATEAVIEMPMIYPSRLQKGNPNDILTLAFRAGFTAGRLPPTTKVVTVFPTTWKGQVSKNVHHARVRDALSPEEISLIPKLSQSLSHNVWDAVALGLWYLKRTKKGGGVT